MAINTYFRNFSTLVKRGAMLALFGSITALVASCGGGGTTSDPRQVGDLAILPGSGTLYANVPQTFTIAGGRGPFIITSSENTVIPLNMTLNGNSFTVTPNQPGVVDPQEDPNVVPSRSVIITVRDAAGTQITATYNVLQNFLTGYNLSITTTATCAAAASTTSIDACAGADSLISLVPISAGLRFANKQMRLCATFGPFDFIVDSTGTTNQCVTVTADSGGNIFARIRVRPNVPTQYAQFRLTDVATGQYRDITFVVTNASGNQTELSLLPTTVSLTGANSGSCGTGLFNLFVFGGSPPYTAGTTQPSSISITPPIVNRSGDAFSVQVFNPNVCLTTANVVVTDAAGRSATMDITTTAGTTPAPTPLSVAPSTLCVPDMGSGVINITGGNNNKVINSSNPGLATASPTTGTGNFTASINAAGAGGAIGTSVTLTVSDGANTATVNILRKTTCP